MSDTSNIELFQEAAKKLPAYKQFLAKHNFDPSIVVDQLTFMKVPLSSKRNYLNTNTFKDLVWKDQQAGPLQFCSTSGSTGEPYYFPRNEELSQQYSCMLEEYLNYSSYGKGSTLVIIGFGMGVWIGGIITLRAFEIAGQRMKAPLSVLPAGYNKTEIFKALRKLAPNFDQTIIVGYPPFVKELVDEAESEHINLSNLNIRFLFAAEAFSETFRNYVCQASGIKQPLLDTLNIYGTADIGAMAYETPLSILIRQLVIEDPLLNRDVFGQIEKTPTLAQYNPEFINFEAVDGEIILTSNGALPLVRYAVGDHGGVFDYNHIEIMLNRYGINLNAEIDKAKIAGTVHKQQPFVFVYERVDLSVTLHGINIYPEFIKEGLLQGDMPAYFTERFTMSTKNDIHHNQFIQINLELQKDIEPTEALESRVRDVIRESLVARSSEFAEVAKSRLIDQLLQIVLWPNGHQRYFAPGTKQKWVEKT